MVFGFATETVVLIAVIVFFAGIITGITGFGYALIGTVGSAAVIGPQQAVVLMIIPVFVSNIPLLGELDHEQLLTCGRR
ncbi:MAG TPA: sulfite exporter TauE/SafE family protein, partial [Halococcus sp.]|nr:sulfite exporter TauE/SafE family protein [Halococcus sp.]